ncbi:MAG: DUF1648 domain-containing protein [Nanoarchaeota archaeon]
MTRKEIYPILIIIAIFAFSFYLYPTAPDELPTHWNAQGEVDDYGSRFTALFLMPLLIVFVYLMLLFLPKMAVFKKNIDQLEPHLYGLKMVIILFFAVIWFGTIAHLIGIPIDMTYLIGISIAGLFYYLGDFLKNVKRNYFVGIRTPWTLSSDLVWDKTHRLGSITFRANAVIIVLSLLYPLMLFPVMLITIFANVVFLLGYSFYVFKKEKNPRH